MAISYCIIEKLDLYFAHWSGGVDLEAVMRNFDRYRADPRFRNGRRELIDLRQVTDIPFGIPAMQSLVMKFNAQRVPPNGETKTIILAGNALTYGRARQFQTLAAMQPGMNVQLTRSEFQALHDLQISSVSIDAMLRSGPGGRWTVGIRGAGKRRPDRFS